ncbi:MAG: hypothetical protein ACC645_07615 [Pirellulales bacterium]
MLNVPCRVILMLLFTCLSLVAAPVRVLAVDDATISLENTFLKYVIASDGHNLHFIDKATGVDYCDQQAGASFAHVTIDGQQHDASSVVQQGEQLAVTFGDTGATARLKLIVKETYLVLEVVSLEGQGVESLTLADIRLTLKALPEEPFAACALALNLKTNVARIPQASSRLLATCHARFGFAGAQVALIGCPQHELRAVMKEVVTAAPDLPHSSIGGPWALDAEINKGSYLFNFGGMSEEKVADWIQLARSLGINQIDFHGGTSFRFGDCRPNPKTYPHGFASFKAVIDRLHASGIKAGLHTYAFFIDKHCPWVTPVPDPRLGKDATFTLAGPLTADATAVPVVEPTEKMSTTTGFFVRNSVTLHVDDELITYSGISKEPPYAFTDCQRGALGTKQAPHAAGAKVHHLKECFGLFCPDGDSTLLAEVAARTAEAYNECGFDMMYLDALDGEDILGGRENAWHYGSKYVFELFKRVKKDPVMEMSTFHHHLWYVRARMGAWDHPTRSHKKFIDIHCQANQAVRRQFLPGHLGWWAVKTWTGPQGEPTFADDIEYLCAKCIGTDVGFSVMGVNPGNITKIPAYQRLAGIMKQYETLRHANTFDASIKAKLAEPGKEFTLFRQDDGSWRFRRVAYAKHKVEGIDGWSNTWTTDNPYGEQPLRLRIEALMSAGPYEADDNVTLADFSDAEDLSVGETAKGITATLQPTADPVRPGGTASGALTAENAGQTARRAAWAKVGKIFAPVRNLSQHQAMGLWVHGDGKGQVLNLQLTCPSHIVAGIGEHYIVVDFTGWRYFQLIEPEGDRYSQYSWPYGAPYAIYREHIDYSHVERLNLWCNNLPPNEKSTCYLSPIKALPLVPIKLKNPAVVIDGKRIVFPVEIESGSYLEFFSATNCKLYGRQGELLREVTPRGEAPNLRPGANRITFACDASTGPSPRGNVTVITQGEPL